MLRTRLAPRRGVILLVVICMLTLFALLGLTFVYYADANRQSSRLHLEAQRRPEVAPELLLSYFLGQLLFDAPDDEAGFYSALRGHSLARSLLGMNYARQADGSLRRNATGELVDAAGRPLNDVPFNGVGRPVADPRLPFPIVPDGSPPKVDANLINYTYFAADGFLRDPERFGWRTGPTDAPRPFAGGFNVDYTYPDLNHVYLAAVKADGTLLAPSYHRPWAGFGTLQPNNWRWTSNVDPTLPPSHPLHKQPQPWLKYLTLRPRPVDMGPGFPLPEDAGGDVKNLIGGPGGNDSIWIDLGFPVLRTPDGKKFKPLFAPLVLDLDNRVNLNVHGNLRGPGGLAHASHQGWGPWEVNPGQLVPLPRPNNPAYAAALARRQEWANLLAGGAGPWSSGRYGRDRHPHSARPGNLAAGPVGHDYAPLDYDGSRELPTGTPAVAGRPTARLRLPGTRNVPPFFCFPAMPARAGYGNGDARERANHPSLFNPFGPFGPDRAFALSNLEALLRHDDTGGQALNSELLRLLPRNFRDPADVRGSAQRRRMVTLASFDPDRPGVAPWFAAKSVGDTAYLRLPPREPLPSLSPYHPSGGGLTVPPLPPLLEGEFGLDGRAAAALTRLRRLDLNRYLPDYPVPNATTGRIDNPTRFLVAQVARQLMAGELFEVLWRVTGAGDPALAPPPGLPTHDAARWDALRYLAQLAVNIVDFIDGDDYMTPFNWYANAAGRLEWVYGTELPRLVINEAYAEYTNLPGDRGLAQRPPRATRLKGNVWVELHNPFQDDPPLTSPSRRGTVQLEIPAAGGAPAYGAYRLVLARLLSDIRQPDNVRGEISAGAGFALSVLSSFSAEPGTTPPPAVDTRVVLPADRALAGGYRGPESENKGFYVLGPHLTAAGETSPFPAPAAGRVAETLRRSEMSYEVTVAFPTALIKPSVLWQRLACPHLPPQLNPLQPFYNPYVTVDYLRDVPANYAAAVGITGPNAPPPVPVVDRQSIGRRQPFAAHPSQLRLQQPSPAQASQPKHTFFQHNADNTTPAPNWRAAPRDYPAFDWLLHADRPLSSPGEVLHVSGFKPHELTQMFRTGDTDALRYTHRAPWLDEGLSASSVPQSYRLYRALEFLSTRSRMLGMMTATTAARQPLALPGPFTDRRVTPAAMAGTTASGGNWRIEPGCTLLIDQGRPTEEVVRVKAVGPTSFVADFLLPHAANFTIAPTTISERLPGKINLNTVWDEEVFVALCDPTSSNTFNAATARAIFTQLKASRTVTADLPGPNDRPFRGLATGLTPSGGGLHDTLLRFGEPTSPSRVPMLAVAGQAHPYLTFEPLTKIFSHATVRSNVFAVWLTVGFFEVTDDAARPVKLGAEMGRAEGRNVRHRMFAIVDRSVLLSHPGPQPRFDLRAPLPGVATGPVVPYFSVIE